MTTPKIWQNDTTYQQELSTTSKDDTHGSNCNRRMVGGKHYLKTIQPWDAFIAWWGHEHFEKYCLMNATKYIMREKSNKVEDLNKAIHYLEAAIHSINKQKDDASH